MGYPVTYFDASTWETARTLADLGELTARWLLGEIPDSFGYDGPPANETAVIADRLAVLNRHGLITYGSQPGEIDEDGQQRAFVEGLCSRETAARIHAAALPTELVVLECSPRRWGRRDSCTVPITADHAGHVYTTAGGWPSRRMVRLWLRWTGVPRPAVGAAARARKIAVVDPAWGRNDLLWDTLLAALAESDAR